ncbi:3-dehydroquinate synthase [Planctomicrobium sp. SH661]|uniref:3-dehydroquinate synthase n=1 Tax=Planctomicrobium sp. SH661 TaxID=3448124 RepID=UPI003F5BE0E2
MNAHDHFDGDVTFSVPCLHRLRFTQDVFQHDQDVLLQLIEASGETPPRVQFWIDEHVVSAQPQLTARIRAFVQSNRDRLQMPGKIQICPGGEAVKNDIHLIERMLKCIHAADLDRRSYVIVIGGGAVLDAVGFAAAISHRGIRLIRLPTTTLAQGDSGVGVKNSVNLFEKKNWVGTFAVPWAVINDQSLLSTLPDRDFLCGFSEAVKVALLKDPEEFNRIEQCAGQIRRRNPEAVQPVLRRAAQLHLQHITQGGDPFEVLEARPLDYGHWSAHKLEPMTKFELRHGEAVAIGVAIDTVYSSLVHGFPAEDAQRVLHCLKELGLNLHHPALKDSTRLFQGLEEFRQHLGGRLTVTMLQKIGQPINVHEIDKGQMQTAIDHVMDFGRRHAASSPASGISAT